MLPKENVDKCTYIRRDDLHPSTVNDPTKGHNPLLVPVRNGEFLWRSLGELNILDKIIHLLSAF